MAAAAAEAAAARACELSGRLGGGGSGPWRCGGARAWRRGAQRSSGLAVRDAEERGPRERAWPRMRGGNPESAETPRCGPSVAAEVPGGAGGSRQGCAGCAGHSSPHCRRPSPPRGWDTGVHTLGDFALA